MALLFPKVSLRQVHPYIGKVLSFSQIVVAHQPVKINGRCIARIGDITGHLGNGSKVIFKFFDHPIRGLQCGAFRHVHNDLEFIFVIKGQHF